jgi:hypothetical protein
MMTAPANAVLCNNALLNKDFTMVFSVEIDICKLLVFKRSKD